MAPTSKDTRAVALKHLDLYKKWKAAAARGKDGAEAHPNQLHDGVGAGAGAGATPKSGDAPPQPESESDPHDELERLASDMAAEGDGEGDADGGQSDPSDEKHSPAAPVPFPRSEPSSASASAAAAASASVAGPASSAIEELYRTALSDLIPSLATSLSLNAEGLSRAERFVSCRATLFRFYRRARYSVAGALELLHTTLAWRASTELDLVSLGTLHPLYVHGRAALDAEADGEADAEADAGAGGSGGADDPDGHGSKSSGRSGTPLFWLSSRFVDRFGRPCGVISLRALERVAPEDAAGGDGDGDADGEDEDGDGDGDGDGDDDGVAAEGDGAPRSSRKQRRRPKPGGLDEVKEYIVACMEITRKYLGDAYRRYVQERGGVEALLASTSADIDALDEDAQLAEAAAHCPPLQMTIAFDLASSGMANLELELLPFLLDLLKNHFPGMVGAVYVLHFSWLHSGMWAVAKRVLPQQALARIFFPSDKEMRDAHFAPHALPRPLGGEWDTRIDSASNATMRKFGRRTPFAPRVRSRTHSRAHSREHSHAASPAGSPRLGSAPLPGAAHKSSLSRSASFESIYDVFYSAEGTPWASRHGSPRQSQPSTPGFDGGATRAGSGRAGWRMTPGAARKLKSLQMSRGDSGGGGGGTGTGTGTGSSSRRAAGELAHASLAPSSSTSASVSPQTALPHQNNSSPGYFGDAGAAPTASANRSRANSLSSLADEDEGRKVAGGRSRTNSARARRVGGLRRDFQLRMPTKQEEDEQRDRLLSATNSSEDEAVGDFVAAGKRRDSDATVTNDESFLARWRRRSSMLLPGQKAEDTAEEPPATPTQTSARQLQKEREELERYRRNLQRAHEEQQQLRSSDSEGPSAHAVERLRFSNGLGLHAALSDHGSPRFQIEGIDEPPLASQTPYHVPRFASVNRSRKYNKPGQVSPYNAENPFFGYPAYISPGARGGAGGGGLTHGTASGQPHAQRAEPGNRFSLSLQTPRHMHARRRKRDLVRTLSYLFFLRILAAHRSVRWRFRMLWRQLTLLLHADGGRLGRTRTAPGSVSGAGIRVGAADGSEADMLWSAEAARRRSLGQAPSSKRLRARQDSASAARSLLLRKRVLVLFVLLACLHSGWRAKVFELLWLRPRDKTAPAAPSGSNRSSYTGLHVRKRLGLINA